MTAVFVAVGGTWVAGRVSTGAGLGVSLGQGVGDGGGVGGVHAAKIKTNAVAINKSHGFFSAIMMPV